MALPGHQLLIDKMILQEVKPRHKNLEVIWIDIERHNYDSVPHGWILECLRLVNCSPQLIAFMRGSMKQWQTELTVGGNSLGLIDINCGDSLSPLLFVLCLFTMSRISHQTSVQ